MSIHRVNEVHYLSPHRSISRIHVYHVNGVSDQVGHVPDRAEAMQ